MLLILVTLSVIDSDITENKKMCCQLKKGDTNICIQFGGDSNERPYKNDIDYSYINGVNWNIYSYDDLCDKLEMAEIVKARKESSDGTSVIKYGKYIKFMSTDNYPGFECKGTYTKGKII